MGITSKPVVLAVDDNKQILDLIHSVLKEKYDVITTQSPSECLNILQESEVGVVISDYQMDEITGIELLNQVHENFPGVRRILLSGHLNLEVVMESINRAEINKVLQKPINSHELISEVLSQMEEYHRTKEQDQELTSLRGKYQSLSQQLYEGSDQLMNLLMEISDIKDIDNFSEQFIKALEGIRSLTRLNLEIYFKTKERQSFTALASYLSDIEVMANQFDQQLLRLYVLLLRSYIFYHSGKMQVSLRNFEGVSSIYNWIGAEYIPSEIKRAIENFPTDLSDLPSSIGKTPFNKEPIINSKKLEQQIMSLIDLNVEELVKNSSRLIISSQEKPLQIQYLMIIADSLPVYEYQNEGVRFELALVSGFFVALSGFLQELAGGRGDFEKIKYDRGVILVHIIGDHKYIMMTKSDNLRIRLGLREFAHKIHPRIIEIPKNRVLSGEDKNYVDRQLRKYLLREMNS